MLRHLLSENLFDENVGRCHRYKKVQVSFCDSKHQWRNYLDKILMVFREPTAWLLVVGIKRSVGDDHDGSEKSVLR